MLFFHEKVAHIKEKQYLCTAKREKQVVFERLSSIFNHNKQLYY